jgi:hypothetical protein
MSHKPGRGHRRKSDPHSKKRFQKKAKRKKAQAQKAYEEAQQRWRFMTEEQRKFRPELHPDNFKP